MIAAIDKLSMRTLTAFLAFGLCLGVASEAAAKRRKDKLLILLLEADDIPSNLALAVNAAVRDEAASASLGLKLLPPPAMDFTSMQLAAACIDDGASCLAGIGRTLGASKVMRVQLTGPVRKATFKLTVVNVRSRKAKKTEITIDDLDSESLPQVRWWVSKILGGNPKPLVGAIALVIGGDEGSLDEAELFLDDRKVTEASLAKVSPGRHRLEVRQKGYESFLWMGNVRSGQETLVTVKFNAKIRVTPPISKAPPKGPGELKAQKPEVAKVAPPVKTAPPNGPNKGAEIAPPPPSAEVSPDGPRLVYTWVFLGAGAVSLGAAVGFVIFGQRANDNLDRAAQDDPALYARCRADDPPRGVCDGITGDVRNLTIASIGNIAGYALAGVFGALSVWQFFEEDGPLLFSAGPTAGGASASVSMRF